MKNILVQELGEITTPAYVVDERLLKKNLDVLQGVQRATGCKILLALKGFSMHAVFPLIGEYLYGITASSLFEARLGSEEMGKEVHVYAPAYRSDEFAELMTYADHVVFNSPTQIKAYAHRVKQAAQERHKDIDCGLRINPEYSEAAVPMYDPCYAHSRLGTTLNQLLLSGPEILAALDGLHFHTLCEQNADALEHTWQVVEDKFGFMLHQLKWINFGGGHHITRDDYQLEVLHRVIRHVQQTYQVEVYLEPGEAIALHTGYLVSRVLDIVSNGMEIAILDTSAACHMPDVLEMPYRPYIIDSGKPQEKAYTYRLGGVTCLAGDVIGDYSFDAPLAVGDMLIFTDMAHYTMVKNNTFNGINLPSIYLLNEKGTQLIRSFGFEDYKGRLS